MFLPLSYLFKFGLLHDVIGEQINRLPPTDHHRSKIDFWRSVGRIKILFQPLKKKGHLLTCLLFTNFCHVTIS
jgi:hypothetical protein